MAQIALDVWGNREKAVQFLLTPHPKLNGQTPVEATLSGSAAKVKWLLGEIMHGLPA